MINTLIEKMIEYYKGDPKRIQHFIKVHSFCKLIGEQENLPQKTQYILEISGIVHDIGIKISEQKYGSSNGKLQEQEGPAVAHEMLSQLGFEKDTIERVCFLIAHHHTYDNIKDIDYQILVESDFLVNVFESNSSNKQAPLKIFKTNTGINLYKTMFDIN